jgi:hypothetical protein
MLEKVLESPLRCEDTGVSENHASQVETQETLEDMLEKVLESPLRCEETDVFVNHASQGSLPMHANELDARDPNTMSLTQLMMRATAEAANAVAQAWEATRQRGRHR